MRTKNYIDRKRDRETEKQREIEAKENLRKEKDAKIEKLEGRCVVSRVYKYS